MAVTQALAAAPAPAEQTWVLQYQAPPPCPSEATFRKALELRMGATARASVPKRLVWVEIRPAGQRWVGLVTVTGADGNVVERRADAGHCDELTPALSLMTAIALELDTHSTLPPVASTATPSPPVASTATPSPPVASTATPSPSVVSTATLSPPAASAATLSPPAATLSPPVASAAPPAARPTRPPKGSTGTSRQRPWAVEASIMGRGRSMFEMAVLGGSLEWSVRSSAPRGFSPLVRLGVEMMQARFGDADAGAFLKWWMGHADVCTHKWPLWNASYISPCARFEAGALLVDGRQVRNSQHSTEQWFAADALAEFATPVFGPIMLHMEAGLSVPIVHHRFYVDTPDNAVATTPNVLVLGGIGLGVRLW